MNLKLTNQKGFLVALFAALLGFLIGDILLKYQISIVFVLVAVVFALSLIGVLIARYK